MVDFSESNKAETAFARQFNMTVNPLQRKGTGYDFTCMHTGRKYELKVDKAAEKTGNVFIELSQTNDGENWVPSGFSLSKSQAYCFVIKVFSEYIFCSCFTLDSVLSLYDFPARQTRQGVNGNKTNSFARGVIIPIPNFKMFSFEVTPEEN